MASTSWGTESGAEALYSDWKVSFTATAISKSKDDSDSVSTQSLSDDSVHSNTSPSADQQQDENPQEKIFSIHRNMVGPKSKFFTKTFGSDEKATVIALPTNISAHTFESVVDAFEVLLDYCYMGQIREDVLVTDNAVAMFCLCNYFEMESEVCEMVNDFIKSDLSNETVAKYYQIAKDLRVQEASPTAKYSMVLNAEPIMKMIVDMCHQSPNTLNSDAELFKSADLTLFLSIGALLAEDNKTSADASKTWSENFMAFFDTYQEEDVLDLKESFRTLTAENILPELSPKVALKMLEHERKHGLASLTRRIKKEKEIADENNISPMSSNDTEEGTVSTTGDSDLDVVLEEELLGTENITSLQKRCIKALCESNWYGKENDIEQMRGKLVNIMTPSVLEALLIDSVTGERALGAKMEEMTTERESEKKVLKQEMESYEFKKEETKAEVAKEHEKQQTLQEELDSVREELENLKASSRRVQEKSTSVHGELCKANALLEAELEKEKKKWKNLNTKYRAMERAQNKIETDREMFELSVKDTIKRLDALTSYDEAYGGCGLGGLVFLISAFSDRAECSQIREMLKEVVKDPLTYERNYLKNVEEDRDDEPDVIMQIGDEPSFLYE